VNHDLNLRFVSKMRVDNTGRVISQIIIRKAVSVARSMTSEPVDMY